MLYRPVGGWRRLVLNHPSCLLCGRWGAFFLGGQGRISSFLNKWTKISFEFILTNLPRKSLYILEATRNMLGKSYHTVFFSLLSNWQLLKRMPWFFCFWSEYHQVLILNYLKSFSLNVYLLRKNGFIYENQHLYEKLSVIEMEVPSSEFINVTLKQNSLTKWFQWRAQWNSKKIKHNISWWNLLLIIKGLKRKWQLNEVEFR